jgi:hypothetical protein
VAPSKYDFTPTEREKRLGMLKFGADWQFGDDWTCARVDRFLNLLELRFRPPVEYLADGECPKAWPVEALECAGPEEQREDTLREYRCAVLGKKQLADVRELLRLYDKYELDPKGPDDFERLDPGDDREKLREVRRLIAAHSQADEKPSVPPVEKLPMVPAPEAVIDAATPKSVLLKRPKRARNKGLPPNRRLLPLHEALDEPIDAPPIPKSETPKRVRDNELPPKKVWRQKPGATLTGGMKAVLRAHNALWPDGNLDHTASNRNKRINQWLKSQNNSGVSDRSIQRARKKIEFR